MKKLLFQKDVLWAVGTGVLFATSYPPFRAWALFFCFAPLWIIWFRAKEIKRVFLTGFVAQFVMTIIGFNWIAHTAVEYGHIPLVLSFLILIGYCCFASLNVMFAGVIAFYFHKKWNLKPVGFFVLVAVLSAAGEWFYPRIFAWNTGYPLLFSKLQTSQLAEFVGFNLLALLVHLANACFAISFVSYPKKRWSWALIVFIVALFVTETLGNFTRQALGREDRSIQTLIVQPNIGNYDKLYAERGNGFQAPIVEKDFSLTNQGLQKTSSSLSTKPQLIVWPETAYPASLDPYFSNQFYPKLLFDFAKNNHIKMIVGSYSMDPPQTRNPKDYNAVFAIDENGQALEAYRKRQLLAFGEYFPGAEYLPFLKKIVPEISDFGRGKGPAILQFPDISFAPLICYEGLDTQFVGNSINLNPQIMVNVTNDSWFGKNFEPYQHMIMTLARTVEFRRPMIRATNTGFSVVADSRGDIIKVGPQDVEWAESVPVPYFSNPKMTLFSKIVPYLSIIFLILIAGAIGFGRLTRER